MERRPNAATRNGERRRERRRIVLGLLAVAGFAAAFGLPVALIYTGGAGGAGGGPSNQGPGREAASVGTAEPRASPEARGTTGQTAVTIYSSPTCGCCAQYAVYLEEEGFQVTLERTNNVDEIKDSLGIPDDVRSCHTAVIGRYFVEGHVPVAAIAKLLEEQPEIDGIALPGMPSGSPGMLGSKEGPFVIYAVADGAVSEFMTL